MKPYSFALVGSGWRAAFYARLTKKLPQRFHLAGTWFHTPEKADAWQAQYGGETYASLEALCARRPELVVVAIHKEHSFPLIMELLNTDIPLLLETPPAVRIGQLYALWEKAKERRAPVMVAEQYPEQPYFAAWREAVGQGLIGQVSNVTASVAHGYHAVALLRQFLQVKGENARIQGSQYCFPVQQTGDRSGLVLHGKMRMETRKRAVFVFESGKTAFYDFSSEQYHASIRFRHWGVQGDRGEIFDDHALCLTPEGQPLQLALRRHQRGLRDCGEYGLQGLSLGERWLYQNPYPRLLLSDDEIALAVCLERMGKMVRGEGDEPEGYPLAEALQDAYLAALMGSAIDTRQELSSRDTPWKQALG